LIRSDPPSQAVLVPSAMVLFFSSLVLIC
jgi:hypothetical protein